MNRLLVVGDGSPAHEWLSAARLDGCEIVGVFRELDALRTLTKRSCDVIVTDPRAPARVGLALLKEAGRISPGIRAILIAPEATPADVITALRESVFACFTMPLDVEDFVSMVKHAVEERNWRNGIEVLSATPDWIQMRVSCRLVTGERLIRFVAELSRDLPESDKSSLMTAFRELLFNAMEHGAGFDPDKVVEVSAVRTERTIVYHFRDPGPGFRFDQLHHAAVGHGSGDPVAHLDHREELGKRPGGFGILLAKRLVDELIYNERGNEALLIKHREGPRTPSADTRAARTDV
jgi:anti-sigma regulatory factor (Ser/Thr protein kinase)